MARRSSPAGRGLVPRHPGQPRRPRSRDGQPSPGLDPGPRSRQDALTPTLSQREREKEKLSQREKARRAAGDPKDSSLAERVVQGDRRAAARLISLVENDAVGVEDQLRQIVPHTGGAHIVGVTGPAGSGKSTLVWKLIGEYRSRGKRVGVVAVDPTSPFTGGAVLGDRVRMQELTLDRGVFIRSMASRGALGGLARAAADAVKVLDAFGCDVVFVETVGAGQDEVDIARTAHTTVVVQVPGMGDEVQAIKAGILEIGDVFAVNKSDRVRADITVSELKMVLETATRSRSWMPPVVKTIATRGEGIVELADAIDSHLAHLRDSGELAERLEAMAERELAEAVRQQLLDELRSRHGVEFETMVRRIAERRVDARTAARDLVGRFQGSSRYNSRAAEPSSPASEGEGESGGEFPLGREAGGEDVA